MYHISGPTVLSYSNVVLLYKLYASQDSISSYLEENIENLLGPFHVPFLYRHTFMHLFYLTPLLPQPVKFPG